MSRFYVGHIYDDTNELWREAQKGNYLKVKDLVEGGADCSVKGGRTQCSPLHIACLMGHEIIVRFLLDFYDSHKKTFQGRNAREQGIVTGSMTRTDGRPLDEVDKNGYTPIFYACGGLRPRVVEILIACGADISSAVNHHMYTPIDYAAVGCIYRKNDNDYMVCISAFSLEQSYAQLEVVENAQLEVVEILLRAGVVLHKTSLSSLNNTVWRSAIEARHGTELLELLLRERPNVDIPTYRNGSTIIHAVADLSIDRCQDGRDIRMVSVLVAYGLDPFHKNNFGETPLHNAVRSHNVELIRYLCPLLIATHEDSKDILNALWDVADPDTWTEIENIVDDIGHESCVAFAMGLQERLGVGSRVLNLKPELLRMVLERVLGRVE